MQWGRVSKMFFVCIALVMLGWLPAYGAQGSEPIQPSAAIVRPQVAALGLGENQRAALADPYVVLVSPPRNALAVSPVASIKTTFSEAISVTTLTTRTVVAHGAQTGRLTATLAYADATFTAILTPAAHFKPGEVVWTSVTSDVQNVAGQPITPTVWQFTAKAAIAGGVFAGQYVHGVGSGPRSIAAGDLDGDGDLDLVTSNYDSDNVTVLYNDGNYIFTPSNTSTVGDGPNAVATGDLDEDGDLDLVVVRNGASNNITVLFNQGNGTFAPATYCTASGDLRHVALGDVDGDGDLDMIVVDYASTNLSVLFNTGSGSFGPPATHTVTNKPRWVAVGDLDNDGDLDLAAVSDRPNTNNISMLRNLGGGAFAASVYLGVTGKPLSISVGDLDADGDLDLAVSGENTTSTVSIFRNNGSGAFDPAVDYTVGASPRQVTAGDLDGDGDLDLATANYTPGTASVMRNEGGGNFADPVTYGVQGGPSSLVMGDLDTDGDLDLAVANSSSNTVSILYNNRPPDTPHTPTPANGVTNIPCAPTLSWECDDPDPGDGLTFTVAFGTSASPPIVAQNVTTTTFSPGLLQPYTTYHWIITATDGLGSKVSPVWHFTTLPLAPTGVMLGGPSSGLVDASQTFSAVVAPITATQPITYIWQATGQAQVMHLSIPGYTDMMSFTWPVSGTKAITATATNVGGTVQDTCTITLMTSDIAVIPSALAVTLALGGRITPTLTISNAGDSALTWNLTETLTVDWLSETPLHGAVPAGDSRDVVVTFDASGLSDNVYTTTLRITSNDPDESPLDVPVTLTVATPIVTPTSVVLSGPSSGLVNASQTFTAVVAPITATQPITYIWQATGQTEVAHSSIYSHIDTVNFTWAISGTKVITVTATNVGGTVQETHVVTLFLLPDITVTPPTLAVMLAPGGTSSATLTIGNVGSAALAWNLEEAPSADWLSEAPISGTVSVGDSKSVAVTFDATGLGEDVYTTTLRITSNDPDEPLIDILVTLTVATPPASVTLSGPLSGTVSVSQTFTAVVVPITATQPITYIWQATGQTEVAHSSIYSHIDAMSFTWAVSGTKVITVTATNAQGTVQDTHTITLTSESVPDITVTPPALAVTLAPGGTSSSTLTIGNVGQANLAWSLTEMPAVNWLSEAPTGTIVSGGDSQGVAVTFNAAGLGEDIYTATLRITSNDSDDSLIDIPVTLTVELKRIYLPILLRRWPPVPYIPVLAEIDNGDGDGSYQVSWSSADLATSYVLEQAKRSDFADAIVAYTGTATSIDLAGRGAGRYYYRVEGRNTWGGSGWSNARWVDVLWEAEPNDTASQANGPLVSGLTYYGAFSGASGTSDYFYFDSLAEHSVELWLTNIPSGSDYDLVVYDSNLVRVGHSGTPGSGPEHILETLPAGHYFVRVYHQSGTGGSTPYHLRLVYQ